MVRPTLRGPAGHALFSWPVERHTSTVLVQAPPSLVPYRHHPFRHPPSLPTHTPPPCSQTPTRGNRRSHEHSPNRLCPVGHSWETDQIAHFLCDSDCLVVRQHPHGTFSSLVLVVDYDLNMTIHHDLTHLSCLELAFLCFYCPADLPIQLPVHCFLFFPR